MILDFKSYKMHTYLRYAKTPMHVLFKWSAASSLAGVLVGHAKRGSFVHTWILCGTCVGKTRTAVDSQTRSRGLFSPTRNGIKLGAARSGLEKSLDLSMM